MRAAPDLTKPAITPLALPQEFRFFERTTVVVLALFNAAFVGVALVLVLRGQVPLFGSLVVGAAAVLMALALVRMDRLRVRVGVDGLRIAGGGIHYQAALRDIRIEAIEFFTPTLLWRAGRPGARGFHILGFSYYEYPEPLSRKSIMICSTERMLRIPTREFDLIIGLDRMDRLVDALHAAVSKTQADAASIAADDAVTHSETEEIARNSD